MKYRTKTDIVIPAGTEVAAEPPHRRNFFTDRASVLTAVTRDTTAEWHMDLKEALEAGLVEEG